MRPVSGLTVIGCPYCYNAWDVEAADGVPVFHSKIKQLKHREIDAYTDSGVFQTMGVPVFIEDLDYQKYRQYAPYEGLTRNASDAVFLRRAGEMQCCLQAATVIMPLR